MELVITQLSKSFGDKKVLSNLAFSLDYGNIYALMGSNGIGKSTLINCLASIVDVDQAEVKDRLGNLIDLKSVAWKKQIGFLSDIVPLIDEVTAIDFLMLHSAIYEVPKEEALISIEKLYKLLFNNDSIHENKNPLSSYSTGMRKKVKIISSLLHSPKFIFLDEPFTGLDNDSCEILSQLLVSLASQGKSILFSSHEENNINATTTNILHLDGGKIQVLDQPESN